MTEKPINQPILIDATDSDPNQMLALMTVRVSFDIDHEQRFAKVRFAAQDQDNRPFQLIVGWADGVDLNAITLLAGQLGTMIPQVMDEVFGDGDGQ